MALVTRRTVLTLAAARIVGVGGSLVRADFSSDLRAARSRVSRGSSVIQFRSGQMEYASKGQGAPVLMIHGTGGGFDQSLDMASPLAEAGYRLIAPSRFGYLRSAFPEDVSSEAQSDAFLDLLDHLKVSRVAVIGGSAGALSAMQFAIRHPQRCSALALIVPAAYDPGRSLENVKLSPLSEAIITFGLQSDFLYWLGITMAPSQMVRALLATDPELVDRANHDEQKRAQRILWNILPVSERVLGFMNDAKLAGSPKPMALAEIRAPTLAISLEDDHFGTLAAARHISASVAKSRLVTYRTGGHIWIGHNADVFREIDIFFRNS